MTPEGYAVDRCDVVVAGVIAVVSVASWALAIDYDAGQLETDSFAAGRHWAQLHKPGFLECETEVFRISGPEVSGRTWLDGCRAEVGLVDR